MIKKPFKRPSGLPPPDYRTPSPPIASYEPLSPILRKRYAARPSATPPIPEHEKITPEPVNGLGIALGDGQVTADDDNSFALGASDSNGSSGPNLIPHYESRNSSVSYAYSSGSGQQPNERVDYIIDYAGSNGKEKDCSRQQEQTLEERRLEAELLLNFSREACFAVPKTPITLQSPTFSTHRASFSSYAPRPIFSSHSSHSIQEQQQTPSVFQNQPFTQDNELASTVYNAQPIGIQSFANHNDRRESFEESIPQGPTLVQEPKTPEVEHTQEASGNPGIGLDSNAAIPQNDNETGLLSEPEHSIATLLDHQLDISRASNIQISGQTKDPVVEELAATRLIEPSSDATVLDSKFEEPPAAETNEDTTIAKQKKADAPSVCASCNFARNNSNLDADSDSTSWISCDGCRSWFHFACAGFRSEREVRSVDKYRCKTCKPIHGPTTYVRKSTRAHSAIDYAGLNEGVIKTSDEDPEHHYVKDFKNGKKFTPETFARMRPELATAEFFERGDGMKEPVLIPAAFNPRPRLVPKPDIPEDAEDFEDQITKHDQLHERDVLDSWLGEEFEYDTVQDQGQDALDMVIPQNLTVRIVSELYGPDEKIEVIDVKSQNGEDKRWTMKKWVDYYESRGDKVVRNVISLEVSQSKLGGLIRRPKIVRDLDLQDAVWPGDLQAKGEYPKVQFYCLMSVADCYTDFHIDFGGSSVYYHILRGKKTFFFIPPTEKHLKQYEEWCNSPAQNWTFLGDQTKECYRVDLSEGDTMLIPAGWIHAVWTPDDSLVIGGNFLTRMHYPLQIRVAQIEKATNVARKFRYPHFQKVLWYSAIRYMDEDPIPNSIIELLSGGNSFARDPTYIHDYHAVGEASPPGEENYQARYYSKAELDGLPELFRYLLRTALIAIGAIADVSAETRNAVKRSIPKSHNHGEPLEAIKKFAMWSAWKRGNESIPHWAYPTWAPEPDAIEGVEKKLSVKARRRLDRKAAYEAYKIAPDRQSTRPRNQPQNLLTEIMTNQAAAQTTKKNAPTPTESPNNLKRKLEEIPNDKSPSEENTQAKKPRISNGSKAGSRKPACEACRKSRRACKHRDDPSPNAQNPVAPDVVHTSITLDTTPTKVGQNLTNGSSPPLPKSVSMLHVEIVKPDHQSISEAKDTPSVSISGAQNGLNDSPQKASGRTKACKDCRKSKRRCVHDEFGNEDPIKLAEAAIPRPAAKKRKAPQANGESHPNKKAKQPSIDVVTNGEIPNNSVQVSVELPCQSPRTPEPKVDGPYPLESEEITPTIPVNMPINLSAELSPDISLKSPREVPQDMPIDPSLQEPVDPAPEIPTGMSGNTTINVPVELPSGVEEKPSQSRPPPESTDISHLLDPELLVEPQNNVQQQQQQQQQQQPAVFHPEDEVNLIATSPLSDLKCELDPETALISQSLTSSLVSPPDSTHAGSERTPPTTSKLKRITPPTTGASSRDSSRPANPVKLPSRFTPESGTVRRPSTSSTGGAFSRESTSPTMSVPLSATSQKRNKSRMSSDIDVDEESLKLIKELQAEDRGLRKRGRV